MWTFKRSGDRTNAGLKIAKLNKTMVYTLSLDFGV